MLAHTVFVSMNVRLLETLVWVARLGGIGAAARRLNLTQPTVTRRIQELEAELRTTLLVRGGRNVVLTAAGRRCIAHAELILAEMAAMHIAVTDRSAVTGIVRLGVVELVALTWLDRFLQRVREAYPNLTVQIDVDLSSRLIGKLTRRHLDIIMVPGPVSVPNVARVPLGSCALRWMAAPTFLEGAELSLEGLAAAPILSMPPEADAYDMMMDWFRSAGTEPRRVSFCSSLSVVASLVRKGIGISLLPLDIVADDIQGGRLVPIIKRRGGPNPHYSVAYLPSAEMTFLASIADIAQQESWHGRQSE